MGEFIKNHWLSIASFAGMWLAMALPYAHLDISINTGRFIAEIFGFIFFATIIYPIYVHIIKPMIHIIQRVRHIWPILFVGQSTSQNYQDFITKQTQLNQFLELCINKLANFYVMRKDIERIIDISKKYEQAELNHLNKKYFEGETVFMGYGFEVQSWMESIAFYAKNDLKEEVVFNVVNEKKYDPNRPYKEEEKIEDKQLQYDYRKGKNIYLTNLDKINELVAKFNKEIIECERFIEECARGHGPSK